jgi:hypothetical protein
MAKATLTIEIEVNPGQCGEPSQANANADAESDLRDFANGEIARWGDAPAGGACLFVNKAKLSLFDGTTEQLAG